MDCMAAIKPYQQLVFLETGFAPRMLLLLSSWCTREESLRRSILSNASGGPLTKDLEENTTEV